MGGIISGIFGGGGGSSSSSSAENRTTVNVDVSVPLNVDTAGVQRALDALAGSTSSAQLAVAGAVVASSAQQAGALKALGISLEKALAALGGGTTQTQIIVAVIGLVGVLLAARVIKFPKVKA